MLLIPDKFTISKDQEGGAVPVLVLFAAVGLLAFLVISNTFNFKDSLFSSLFPKPSSQAATNLVKNPGCEVDTNGWLGYHANLSRTTYSVHSGVASCRVSYSGSGGYYTLD